MRLRWQFYSLTSDQGMRSLFHPIPSAPLGGALVINNEKFIERAEMIREKGTNRTSFLKKEVDKYSWVDIAQAILFQIS